MKLTAASISRIMLVQHAVMESGLPIWMRRLYCDYGRTGTWNEPYYRVCRPHDASAACIPCEFNVEALTFLWLQVNEAYLGQLIANTPEEKLADSLRPTLNELFGACAR